MLPPWMARSPSRYVGNLSCTPSSSLMRPLRTLFSSRRGLKCHAGSTQRHHAICEYPATPCASTYPALPLLSPAMTASALLPSPKSSRAKAITSPLLAGSSSTTLYTAPAHMPCTFPILHASHSAAHPVTSCTIACDLRGTWARCMHAGHECLADVVDMAPRCVLLQRPPALTAAGPLRLQKAASKCFHHVTAQGRPLLMAGKFCVLCVASTMQAASTCFVTASSALLPGP